MVLSLVLSYSVIFCLLNLCLITSSQSYNNITLGSSLTADSLSTPWLSPSRDFAFGFQEIEPGSFLLAIWFNKIPEKTITWSANRDHLAPKGSNIKLTVDQSLILTDNFDHEIWGARTKGSSPAFASILDMGNLVLVSRSKTIIWESFNEPTDTLFPTQNLTQGGRLIADFSSKNYSSGRFSFDLDYNGNLGLYTTNYPLFNTLNTNYQSFDSQGLGYQVIVSYSGSFYLADNQGDFLADTFPNEVIREKSIYQRVILEYDGVLRHYTYTKNWVFI